MAKIDIKIFSDKENGVYTMIPKSKEAKAIFKQKFKMPENCDGMEVAHLDPNDILDILPRQLMFGSTKIVPKKTFKCLLP